jgi:hypothetical protein
MKTTWRCFSVVLPAILFVTIALGQFRASVQGTVTNPNGSTVPGETVTITSFKTNIRRVVTTSDAGVCDIPGLAPGRYSRMVEKTGFSKKVLRPHTRDLLPDGIISIKCSSGGRI